MSHKLLLITLLAAMPVFATPTPRPLQNGPVAGPAAPKPVPTPTPTPKRPGPPKSGDE